MKAGTNTTASMLPQPYAYLDVVRLDDGRYRVRFVKDGVPPRISHTDDAGDVVRQAERAGNIPVRTEDAELRSVCDDRMVKLITEL